MGIGKISLCADRTPKLFSPNLITLAEKMGFNVERYSKITGPNI
jgi:hypothetical protein